MVAHYRHTENYWVCSEMHEVWEVKVEFDAKATHCIVDFPHREYQISSLGFSFLRCMVVVQDHGRAILCLLTNKRQGTIQKYHISQVERRNRRNSSINIPSTRLHLLFLFLPYSTHCQFPTLSRRHVISTKQRISFQNTPNNLHNLVHSLWASIRYLQLYHNAIGSDVDSFSTPSDGTQGHWERKGEGNCYGKDADIGYWLTPVIASGPYWGIHFGTHPWTHMEIQCLWRHGYQGIGSLLWYNLSWSSHNLPLITIPADVATPQEQVITISRVVGSLTLIYAANVRQNPPPNKELEAGQPLGLWGSSLSF